MASPRMGISGWLAARFLLSPLTPIIAIAALLLGAAAIIITPQEEEPQIDVTMANVMVPFAGADVADVENLVSWPLEQSLAEIEGVKHVYSVSNPGLAALTVEFHVGVPRQVALVRLYNQVELDRNNWPPDLGVGPMMVRPMGIDDVPIMSLTLWSDNPAQGPLELAQLAWLLETELKRVPGTRDVYSIGAANRAVVVTLDSTRLAAHGLTIAELGQALQAANVVQHAGSRIVGNRDIPVTAGTFLAQREDVAGLVIGLHDGHPLYLRDVATIHDGVDLAQHMAWHGAPLQRAGPANGITPAVTLAIAKQPGTNAADITAAINQRVADLRGQVISDDVHVTVTRDYGHTASDKAHTLIKKLIFATLSVVLLMLAALGWREAVVVGSAVVITLALTLFASWAMGFTINRVSLFALIFSIGILVDDAIVVVENIHRHMRLDGRSLAESIPLAVDEVGGPTILATFTVIAALLPMAFVSGLMGPYMRPIPINASAGMFLSLLVALIVTPWMSLKLLRRHAPVSDDGGTQEKGSGAAFTRWLQRLFNRLLRPFLQQRQARGKRRMLFAAMGLLVLGAMSLAFVGLVTMKMLPFDNKSEFQVVLDMPEGSALEQTNAVLAEMTTVLDDAPEVLSYQGYAGTSAPIGFNGLVRQYYLRQLPHMADMQVNLVDRKLRKQQSHAIASRLRPALAEIAQRHGGVVTVAEVPPGPPVMAPIVAEIYGPDQATAGRIALELAQRLRAMPHIVDVDTSVQANARREVVRIDRDRAARLGVNQAEAVQALQAAMHGMDVTHLRSGHQKYAMPVRLRLPAADTADHAALLELPVRSRSGQLVALADLVQIDSHDWDQSVHHKDLRPVAYVFADVAGGADSPLYGMFSLASKLRGDTVAGQLLDQHFISQPVDTGTFALKWDGEWQITFETFRDMGLAYSVGLLLIYLLVVAQFRSYMVPLIIMAPIPLTLIGIMPGHALLGAQFTATSMIGMIALAGIIVRNSILLIDFINQALAEGQPLADAVVDAAAIRAKPILLTALAAMLGAFFILDDPIFNGLAVSLIFGVLVSTLLTLVVIPVLYYAFLQAHPQAAAKAS